MAKAALRPRVTAREEVAGNLRARAQTYRDKGYSQMAADLEQEARETDAIAAAAPPVARCAHDKEPAKCPDCRLARSRQKLLDKVNAKKDERERLARIQAAAPPSHTVDGQLRRWKDQREEGAAIAVTEDDVNDPADLDDADALEAEMLEEAPPLRSKDYATRGRTRKHGPPISLSRPGHRIEAPRAERASGEKSWWETAPRSGMTRAASTRAEKMSASKEGRRVTPREIADDGVNDAA